MHDSQAMIKVFVSNLFKLNKYHLCSVLVGFQCPDHGINRLIERLLLFRHDYGVPNILQIINCASDVVDETLVEIVLTGTFCFCFVLSVIYCVTSCLVSSDLLACLNAKYLKSLYAGNDHGSVMGPRYDIYIHTMYYFVDCVGVGPIL